MTELTAVVLGVALAVVVCLVVWLLWLVIRLRLEAWANRRVIASLQRARPVAEPRALWTSPVLLRFSLQTVAWFTMLGALVVATLLFLG